MVYILLLCLNFALYAGSNSVVPADQASYRVGNSRSIEIAMRILQATAREYPKFKTKKELGVSRKDSYLVGLSLSLPVVMPLTILAFDDCIFSNNFSPEGILRLYGKAIPLILTIYLIGKQMHLKSKNIEALQRAASYKRGDRSDILPLVDTDVKKLCRDIVSFKDTLFVRFLVCNDSELCMRYNDLLYKNIQEKYFLFGALTGSILAPLGAAVFMASQSLLSNLLIGKLD